MKDIDDLPPPDRTNSSHCQRAHSLLLSPLSLVEYSSRSEPVHASAMCRMRWAVILSPNDRRGQFHRSLSIYQCAPVHRAVHLRPSFCFLCSLLLSHRISTNDLSRHSSGGCSFPLFIGQERRGASTGKPGGSVEVSPHTTRLYSLSKLSDDHISRTHVD